MAISTNKKNKIIADWKTGKFKSKTSLAKHYKVDPKTVGKIIGELEPVNAELVEVGAMYENAKKSLKNPIEIKAVEKAVEERTIADEIEGIVFDGTLLNVIGIKKEVESADLEMQDRKYAQETLDKALITVGKAARFAPKTEINNANLQKQEVQDTTINIIKDA